MSKPVAKELWPWHPMSMQMTQGSFGKSPGNSTRGRPMKKKNKNKNKNKNKKMMMTNPIKLRSREINCPKYQGPHFVQTSSTRGIDFEVMGGKTC